jgi:hypothetical protein
MKPLVRRPGVTASTMALLALWLPIAASAQPTNGPLVAFGLTNSPIGGATLEIIDGGVLFVGDTADGTGVSVQLGEVDSGVFLYPLTGYLYGGETIEAKAYGRVNGTADQFISSVRGTHNGDSSGTVTVDFSPLGASRLNIFVGTTLLGGINSSTVGIVIRADGHGCRANPWWRLPDGRFGALIELATASEISIPGMGVGIVGGNCVFIRPEDPTNSVEFVSRVDATSTGVGSFCLTDARPGIFHHRHKALGQATLDATGGRLTVRNITSNLADGVFVELASVNAFDVSLLPLELTGSNSAIMISGYGTSGHVGGTELSTARIENRNGAIQIGVEMGIAPQSLEIFVRSNGVSVGAVTVSSNAAVVNLSGNPRVTGCSLLGKTMDTLPGIAVRVDRPTTFTAPGGETFVGDEVRVLAPEFVLFDSLESFVITAEDLPSFTITGESAFNAPAPALSITRSTNGLTLSWPDANRVYSLEATAALSESLTPVQNVPEFANNYTRVTIAAEANGLQFFRLRRDIYVRD